MSSRTTVEDISVSESASSKNSNNASVSGVVKKPTADVEGVRYKVVWSCLLLVEMIMTNLASAAHFQSLAANAVAKAAELLRLFNNRMTQLVLGAGAIHSAARLKSINAKHLSLVTQCLGMMLSLFPHIRAALMAQLPTKQQTLLTDIDKIKKDYVDHNEKILNKFVTIIGGIVEHGLAPRIANTDFDARARDFPEPSENSNEPLACCVFLDGVSTNTRKMHQVLNSLLPPDHLLDVFSRIFAYLDQQVPALLIAATTASVAASVASVNTSNGASNGISPTNKAAAAAAAASFHFPETDKGKRRLLLEVERMTTDLNALSGVHPWDFTAVTVLERKLEYQLRQKEEEEEQVVVQSAPVASSTTTENEETPAENEGTTPAEEEEDEEKPHAINGDTTEPVSPEEKNHIENGEFETDAATKSEKEEETEPPLDNGTIETDANSGELAESA
jgi:vacuolar protein sorting-associated protein 54